MIWPQGDFEISQKRNCSINGSHFPPMLAVNLLENIGNMHMELCIFLHLIQKRNASVNSGNLPPVLAANLVASIDNEHMSVCLFLDPNINLTFQELDERGQKLGQLSERTEQMRQAAEDYSRTSHLLMQKYKDKKWYQWWDGRHGILRKNTASQGSSREGVGCTGRNRSVTSRCGKQERAWGSGRQL